MIQARLSELGLYKGSIDGIWGKGSQAALRAFKEQNSLSSPGKWDKETQMLLFREVPPTSEAMQKLISSGEILLNPGIPHDA
jgi:peptidoglycan hydrolase-like protein with peptidoglycan-binding domain